MPLYAIHCDECGRDDEMFRKVADCNQTPECCGKPMKRVLTASAVIAGFTPYKSMATGEIIDSRTKHRNMLKQHGLIEVGDQHKAHQREIEQRKKEKAKKESQALRQEIAARLDTIQH